MSDDKLNFLGGSQPTGSEDTSARAAADTATAAPAEQSGEGPQRGPDGRFLTAVPVTDPVSPAPATPTVTPAEPGHVPISALLDEREKRQAEKAQREALERQIAEMRAQATPPRQLEPTEELSQALYVQGLRASRRFAEREYGKETIATVHDWAAKRCDEDPVFNQQMRASEDPYEAAFQAYSREQVLEAVKPSDLAAFKAWQAAQAAGGEGGAPPAAPAPSPAAPRSLATASGTGGAGAPHVPVGPGQAFVSAMTR
jgi:hypothetical protein